MTGVLFALFLSAPADATLAARFLPEALPIGQRAVIVGPYVESIDREIRIEGLAESLRVEEAQTRDLLELKAGQDNVRVEVERTAQGGLRVISIGPGPTDAKIFAEEFARIDPSDAEGLLALGSLVRRREAKGTADLAGIRSRIVESLIARAGAETGSLDRRFGILSGLATSIGDDASLQALARFASDHPTHPRARQILADHGYVLVKGTWRSTAEHKQAMGYVLDGHEWVPRREFLFRRRIRDLSGSSGDPLSRRLTKEIYERYAKSGQVVTGMNRAEIVLAWGWPDGVHRRAVAGTTYEQWVYADRYVYLRAGLAAATERSDGSAMDPPPPAAPGAPNSANDAAQGLRGRSTDSPSPPPSRSAPAPGG